MKTTQYKSILFGVILVFLTGIITLALSIQSIRNDSLTMDELAHTTAAYSYIVESDYRLNPEHPPLLKLVAGGGIWVGSKLTGTKITPPSASQFWEAPNKQWDVGVEFFYTLGNDPQFLMFWSRLPMILISIFGAFYLFYSVYYHTKNVTVATVTGIGFLTSINVLAHARYVTTDVGITLALILVVDWFSRYLKASNAKNTAGLMGVLIIAAFTKFSWVVVGPLFLGILVWYRRKQDNKSWMSITKEVVTYGGLFFLVLGLMIQIVYRPLMANMPLSLQLELIDTSFPANNLVSDVTRTSLTRISEIPGLRPIAHYITGQLMVFQRVSGGNITFLLGQVTNSSFRMYFPITYLVKTPIPFLLLLGMAVLTSIRSQFFKENLWRKLPLFYQILICLVFWYWIVAISSNLNLGIRYILPIVVATELVVWYITFEHLPQLPGWKSIRNLCLVWVWVTPVFVFPSYLGYVNDFIGGERAFQVFVDSNLDWGQDLYRLAAFTEQNNIDTIKLDYFGGGNPQLEFPGTFQNLDSREGPQDGWVAVSATKLQNSRYYQQELGLEDYWWLYWETPEAVIGNSILVYYIEPKNE
jgi:hypothetical protein